ncbi:ATP-grasp domain-containing protein [Fluviispira multicolorata]|uniref:ATP-grasp domain-containing protein n=1 Tax=Fluviispira multicolorata TaxID=2654512 RepID=A0A833N0F4_9BACT|nr:hypothetical protein [Fluviispira multicolorata]KAB8028517.1 hypothetical protein GCL57_12390 [Fluviispira multicolorata]
MKKKILIINRWNDEFSDYRKHLPENQFEIYMLILIGNEKSIDSNSPNDYRISKDLNYNSCKELMIDLILKNSSTENKLVFDELIAFSEYDLIIAAQLRDFFLIPGDNLDKVLLWRDKNLMKERLSRFSIRVPKWKIPNDLNDIIEFLISCKNGIVLKPLREAASIGVFICFTELDVQNIYPTIQSQLFEYEVEEYISAPIGHIDGFVQDGELKFAKVSQYIGTCLSFQKGHPLASYTLENTKKSEKLIDFAKLCLKHLNASNNVFHLEIFIADEPIFLEVGMRIGGGEIPWIMRDVFKINLFDIWMQLIIKTKIKLAMEKLEDTVAGFLMIPYPVNKKLLEIQFDQERIQEIYSSKIMSVENEQLFLDENENMLASFRYRSNNLESLKEAIKKTIKNFRPIFELCESINEKSPSNINSTVL